MNKQLFKDVERMPWETASLYIKDFVDGKYIIGGTVRYNPPNSIPDLFEVLIKIPSGYPYAQPILFEVGGRYNFRGTRHINTDGSCCVEVPAVIEKAARNGLSLARYIKRFVLPFFANQIYFEQNRKFLTERSHGNLGIREHVESILQTSDQNEIKVVFEYFFEERKSGRNERCFCGSGKKYKLCHLRRLSELGSYYTVQTLADLYML